MKLNNVTADIINPRTLISKNLLAPPFITITKNSGQIRFSERANEICKFQSGDVINFFQNDDDKTDWYVGIVEGKGFTLRYISWNDKSALQISSRETVMQMMNCVNYINNSGKLILEHIPYENEGLKVFRIRMFFYGVQPRTKR